ncbi:MAG: hypothetical protein WBE18_04760, partial [Gammaproteobacteria bacterium]
KSLAKPIVGGDRTAAAEGNTVALSRDVEAGALNVLPRCATPGVNLVEANNVEFKEKVKALKEEIDSIIKDISLTLTQYRPNLPQTYLATPLSGKKVTLIDYGKSYTELRGRGNNPNLHTFDRFFLQNYRPEYLYPLLHNRLQKEIDNKKIVLRTCIAFEDLPTEFEKLQNLLNSDNPPSEVLLPVLFNKKRGNEHVVGLQIKFNKGGKVQCNYYDPAGPKDSGLTANEREAKMNKCLADYLSREITINNCSVTLGEGPVSYPYLIEIFSRIGAEEAINDLPFTKNPEERLQWLLDKSKNTKTSRCYLHGLSLEQRPLKLAEDLLRAKNFDKPKAKFKKTKKGSTISQSGNPPKEKELQQPLNNATFIPPPLVEEPTIVEEQLVQIINPVENPAWTAAKEWIKTRRDQEGALKDNHKDELEKASSIRNKQLIVNFIVGLAIEVLSWGVIFGAGAVFTVIMTVAFFPLTLGFLTLAGGVMIFGSVGIAIKNLITVNKIKERQANELENFRRGWEVIPTNFVSMKDSSTHQPSSYNTTDGISIPRPELGKFIIKELLRATASVAQDPALGCKILMTVWQGVSAWQPIPIYDYKTGKKDTTFQDGIYQGEAIRQEIPDSESVINIIEDVFRIADRQEQIKIFGISLAQLINNPPCRHQKDKEGQSLLQLSQAEHEDHKDAQDLLFALLKPLWNNGSGDRASISEVVGWIRDREPETAANLVMQLMQASSKDRLEPRKLAIEAFKGLLGTHSWFAEADKNNKVVVKTPAKQQEALAHLIEFAKQERNGDFKSTLEALFNAIWDSDRTDNSEKDKLARMQELFSNLVFVLGTPHDVMSPEDKKDYLDSLQKHKYLKNIQDSLNDVLKSAISTYDSFLQEKTGSHYPFSLDIVINEKTQRQQWHSHFNTALQAAEDAARNQGGIQQQGYDVRSPNYAMRGSDRHPTREKFQKTFQKIWSNTANFWLLKTHEALDKKQDPGKFLSKLWDQVREEKSFFGDLIKQYLDDIYRFTKETISKIDISQQQLANGIEKLVQEQFREKIIVESDIANLQEKLKQLFLTNDDDDKKISVIEALNHLFLAQDQLSNLQRLEIGRIISLSYWHVLLDGKSQQQQQQINGSLIKVLQESASWGNGWELSSEMLENREFKLLLKTIDEDVKNHQEQTKGLEIAVQKLHAKEALIENTKLLLAGINKLSTARFTGIESTKKNNILQEVGQAYCQVMRENNPQDNNSTIQENPNNVYLQALALDEVFKSHLMEIIDQQAPMFYESRDETTSLLVKSDRGKEPIEEEQPKDLIGILKIKIAEHRNIKKPIQNWDRFR